MIGIGRYGATALAALGVLAGIVVGCVARTRPLQLVVIGPSIRRRPDGYKYSIGGEEGQVAMAIDTATGRVAWRADL